MRRLFILIAALTAQSAFANGPWQVFFQNAKFPTQASLEHYTWVSPVAGASTVVASGSALNNGSATSITTFAGQPDYPRNITIGFGGSTGSVGAGTAVVTGTNIFGKTISENFSISAHQTTTTTGSDAFKTVSSVSIPATSSGGATVYVGVGSKLGITRCASSAGDYDWSIFNGAFETTRGTFSTDASHVELNTFVPNGTMDGTKNVELFFVQNYECYGN